MDSSMTLPRMAIVAVLAMLGSVLQPATVAACTIAPDNGSGTINGNLEPGAVLTITGTCEEDVVITVGDVTLQTSPGPDRGKILSLLPASEHDAVLVNGAKRIVIDGLVVARGRNGIVAKGGASLTVRNALIGRATDANIDVSDGSTALVMDSDVVLADCLCGDDEATGIRVTGNSHAVIDSVTVSLNNGLGIDVSGGSQVEITRTEVSSNAAGMEISGAGAEITSTIVTGNTTQGLSLDFASSVIIGDEDGLSGDVQITSNGGEGLSIIGGLAELANTTIQGNGGFAAIFASEAVLRMDGGNTISQPDINPGPGDSTIFLSNSVLNQFVSSGPDTVTGLGGIGDAAISAFRLSDIQLWNMSISGGAGTGVELNNKAIGQFSGATTVTGGVVCDGSHVEFFDDTGGGVDFTLGCP